MKPKSKRVWLVFDVDNLAWRAHYSTGHLSYNDSPTGVLYGVLKEIRTCMAKFRTDDCVFCFDGGKSYRAEHYPWYKETRRKKKLSDEEAAQVQTCRDQIDQLKSTHLERLGFGNVFVKRGYEADDLIASVCLHGKKDERFVVVTGDEDLYQCIRKYKQVSVYHPAKREEVTHDAFVKTYGLNPSLWNQVKAIAGCASDDIPGVEGVGEKTACVYLTRRDLVPKPRLARIEAAHKDTERNLRLTTLPYPGTPVYDLEADCKVDRAIWDDLMKELGFVSMQSEPSFLPVRGPAAHGRK